MKLLIIPVLLVSQFIFAQSNTANEIVPVYKQEASISGIKTLEIPVGFDASSLQSQIPFDLKNRTIQRIDLVYSTYASSPDFDQDALNNRRVNTLLKSLKVSDNPLIEWRFVGQDQATDCASAKELYHGFVIYYRPAPTKESIEDEISFMDDFLSGKVAMSPGVNRNTPTLPALVSASETHSDTKATPECEELEAIKSPEIESNVFASDTTVWVESYAAVISTGLYGGLDAISTPDSRTVSTYPSSQISKPNREYNVIAETFNRNPKWKNTLVVMDVTGSMSPYIAQTMAWVKETQKVSQIKAFVFFNDGNTKKDYHKTIGSVGGIYSAANTSFDAVYNELTTTMRRGGGGDCPENNVEATIKAIDEYPDCKEIVMMADNWATPRDLSLAASLKKPVHIIVCGASRGINMSYIQLAYDTGGSIHTIEQDIEMRSIKVGERFQVGKKYFKIVKGRIVQS